MKAGADVHVNMYMIYTTHVKSGVDEKEFLSVATHVESIRGIYIRIPQAGIQQVFSQLEAQNSDFSLDVATSTDKVHMRISI